MGANSADIVVNYDFSIQFMENRIDGKDFLGLRQETNNNLEIIDAMESTFEKSNGKEAND